MQDAGPVPARRMRERPLLPEKNSAGTPAVPDSISRSRTVYRLAGSLISWFSAASHIHLQPQPGPV